MSATARAIRTPDFPIAPTITAAANRVAALMMFFEQTSVLISRIKAIASSVSTAPTPADYQVLRTGMLELPPLFAAAQIHQIDKLGMEASLNMLIEQHPDGARTAVLDDFVGIDGDADTRVRMNACAALLRHLNTLCAWADTELSNTNLLTGNKYEGEPVTGLALHMCRDCDMEFNSLGNSAALLLCPYCTSENTVTLDEEQNAATSDIPDGEIVDGAMLEEEDVQLLHRTVIAIDALTNMANQLPALQRSHLTNREIAALLDLIRAPLRDLYDMADARMGRWQQAA